MSEVRDISTENIAKFCEKETLLPKFPFPQSKTQTQQNSPQNNNINDPQTVKLVAKYTDLTWKKNIGLYKFTQITK